jgi:hypothetical protein
MNFSFYQKGSFFVMFLSACNLLAAQTIIDHVFMMKVKPCLFMLVKVMCPTFPIFDHSQVFLGLTFEICFHRKN